MSEGLTSAPSRRKYLADGVYAEYDGFGFWLCTSGPGGLERRIYIEPATWNIMKQYIDKLEGKQWQS